MSERKRLEIKHDELRLFECDLCDSLKAGANLYRGKGILPLFLCDNCVSEIAEDWVILKRGGETK